MVGVVEEEGAAVGAERLAHDGHEPGQEDIQGERVGDLVVHLYQGRDAVEKRPHLGHKLVPVRGGEFGQDPVDVGLVQAALEHRLDKIELPLFLGHDGLPSPTWMPEA